VPAHHGRLHDALAVDYGTQPARPRSIDQGRGHGAAIERCVVAAVQHAVICHDDAHGRIELTEAAQDPVLAPLLVVASNPHGGEKLLGDADLPVPVLAGKGLARAELARLRDARHHPLRVAGTDPIQRLAGDDVEIPRLGVHRRRGAHRQADDLLDQRPGDRIGLVAANAPAAQDDVIELHLPPSPMHDRGGTTMMPPMACSSPATGRPAGPGRRAQ
jgi:hypothetical protein